MPEIEKDKKQLEQDIIKDKTSFFVILYTMLKKVEYLAGYEVLWRSWAIHVRTEVCYD